MVLPFRLIRPWKSNLDSLVCQHSCCYISTIASKGSLDDPSAGLSYLRKPLGISKKINLKTTENTEAVLNVLRSQGFTRAQIDKLISTRPRLLFSDPEKFMKPNFKAFASMGLTGSDVARLMIKGASVLESNAVFAVEFFIRQGFNGKEVLALGMRCPSVLSFNVNTILQPKVDFLESLKLSGAQIRKIITKDPSILTRSLENFIKPSIKILRRVVGDDVNVVKVITRSSWTLRCDLEKVLEPNILLLKNVGVPLSVILKVFLHSPRLLITSVDKLNTVVRYVQSLEIDPSKYAFAKAIHCRLVHGEAKWNRKLETYKSFGLTEEEVLSAISRVPTCMLFSEEKIKEMMTFFVNELKIKPYVLASNLHLMHFSLKERVRPRCSSMQLLVSKRVAKSFNLRTILRYSDNKFVDVIVNKYVSLAPDIVKAFQGKIDFKGFSDGYWRHMTYHVIV